MSTHHERLQAELEQTIANSTDSTTIEWALNMRVCDMLQENPFLTPCAMRKIGRRLRRESPVPVLLALSLLEIIVKNLGLAACHHVDPDLVETLVSLVKRRESWRYSLGRNLNKSVGGGWGIDEEQRMLWLQASHKVREMLQLWADAFLLQEGELRPIFDAYKRLKKEGYTFPQKEHGASAELCLVAGAEQSPAYLAAGGGAVASDSPAEAAAEARPPARSRNPLDQKLEAARAALSDFRELRADPAAAAAVDGGRRLSELHFSSCETRDWAARLIQDNASLLNPTLDEEHLQEVLLLLDDLNAVLEGPSAAPPASQTPETPAEPAAAPAAEVDLLDLDAGAGASSTDPAGPGDAQVAEAASPADSPPLPPPPSEAPPNREEQEMYDAILARYLQDREDELARSQEAEDHELALRLSMEDDMGFAGLGAAAAMSNMVACSQCNAPNVLNTAGTGGSRLFICYACGASQGIPAATMQGLAAAASLQRLGGSRRHRPEVAPTPTRHAPPPRVICAGTGSELLIGGGSAAAAAAEPATASTASSVASAATSAMASRPAMESFEGGAGSEALLGSKPSKHANWRLGSLSSWAPGGSSSSATKSLGDGGGSPQGEGYVAMGDEAAPLFESGGPQPPSKSGRSGVSGLLPWKSRRKVEDTAEPLLERMRVDEEWELIRPSHDRPYWHNVVTQASQWQPPEFVSRGRHASSGAGDVGDEDGELRALRGP